MGWALCRVGSSTGKYLSRFGSSLRSLLHATLIPLDRLPHNRHPDATTNPCDRELSLPIGVSATAIIASLSSPSTATRTAKRDRRISVHRGKFGVSSGDGLCCTFCDGVSYDTTLAATDVSLKVPCL